MHPGWNDLSHLDALIAQARRLSSAGAPAIPAPRLAVLPPALEVPHDVPRQLARAEASRIRQATEPANRRIENLQNTLRVRADRRVEIEQKRGQTLVAEQIRREQARLLGDADIAKTRISVVARDALRDLQLHQIALQSQVDALYPSQARVEARRKLDSVREQIRQEEQKRDAALKAVDEQSERSLESFRADAVARERMRMARYREEQDAAISKSVEDSKAIVGLVLASLSPLQMPGIPPSRPVPGLSVPTPAQVAAAPAPSAAPLPQPAQSAAALAAERANLEAFIFDDVKRRVQRLAIQQNRHIALAPVAGAPDLTDEVAAVLRSEWKP